MASETPSEETKPDRWLHVRHRGGFTDAQWSSFQAHCRYFQASADALLANWVALGQGDRTLRYVYFPPTLSEDRTVATLPLGGDQTLGSRAAIENGHSKLLWCYLLSNMPIEDVVRPEEGLTEHDLIDPARLTTNWRPIAEPTAVPPPSEPPYAAQLAIALATLARLDAAPAAIAPAVFRFLWLVGAPVPPPLFMRPLHLFIALVVFLTVLSALVGAAFAPWLADPLPSIERLLLAAVWFGVAGGALLTVLYRRRSQKLGFSFLRRE